VFTTANGKVVAVAVTGIFLVMILVATGRLRRLNWRGLTVLGALTYPLYLTHSQVALPVLEYAYPALNRWAALALVTAVSLAVAYAVYRLVERPGQAWMRTKLREALTAIRSADPVKPAADDDKASAPVPAPRPEGTPGGTHGGTEPELVRP
jgi:peptidoglycan/LPS O-acetylase OafA/YrhL